MKVLYTAEVTSRDEGRTGKCESSDGRLQLALAPPSEMGGGSSEGTNPEQLFAAGYAACFHSALRTAARRQRHSVEGSEVTARVGVGPIGDGCYHLVVELQVRLPGVPAEAVEELMQATDRVCPYSNAIRGNVDVKMTVVD